MFRMEQKAKSTSTPPTQNKNTSSPVPFEDNPSIMTNSNTHLEDNDMMYTEDFPSGGGNTTGTTHNSRDHNSIKNRKKVVLIEDRSNSSKPPSTTTPEKPSTLKKNRSSMSKSIKANIIARQESNSKQSEFITSRWSNKIKRFNFFFFYIPCFFSLWYAVAILFPPNAREYASFLLWDDGQLVVVTEEVEEDYYYTDSQDHDTSSTTMIVMCPRASICAEGIIQIILIATARLTAFASYVFMGAIFISKMHFLIRFLSSTYLLNYIPFESLHNVHTRCAKIYGGLILVHVLTHYVRYTLRLDVDQLRTKVHVSGLCGAFAMVVLVVGMSGFVKKKRKDGGLGKFETRFNLHWLGMIVLCVCMFIHTPRVRVITLIFLCLWALDYIYGIVFGTYNLQVVELLPLPKKSGLQMLWRNPEGFRPKSGEYVKIKMSWLSKGGDEWHPFSVYLNESTESGFMTVHDMISKQRIYMESKSFEDDNGSNISNENLREFVRMVLDVEYEHEAKDMVGSALVEEAREDIHNQYNTTQVFICPAGDWTKNLMEELENQRQLRACWVRGPYTSPYFIAQNFSHLVLTATGIGITPALGVMGQYPGFSRSKILVWSTRDKNMLKFFAPLIKDAHFAAIYYTGKEKLEEDEVIQISYYGNIFLQQSRPPSGFGGAAESIIVEFENHINLSAVDRVIDIDLIKRAAWCVLYCGGSVRIRNELQDFARGNRLGFESELFDW